jgi:hypothetical protein
MRQTTKMIVKNPYSTCYLHLFNPGHEAAVMNGSPFYVPPANVRLMQRELAFLPAFYAQNADFVIVDENFDFAFYENLKENLPHLPQPISFSCKDAKDNLCNFARPKSLEAFMWGVSPAAIHFFEKIKAENAMNLQIPQWKCEFRNLTSRQTASECLIYLKNKISQISVAVPTFVNSMQDAENMISNADGILIAKSPFSSSGRGILHINPQDFNRATRQILQGMFNKQSCISLEKFLHKTLDFAMEFRCEEGKNVTFAGYSLFQTDEKGGYTGNMLDSQKNIEKQLMRYIDLQLIIKIRIETGKFLSEKFKNYSGFLGIYRLIYSFENKYFIYPCVEINMRANMGIIALNLAENFLFTGKTGRFTVDFCKIAGEILQKHTEMANKFPPRFENGKLFSGYLPLCPVNEKSKYWAYVVLNAD